MTMTSKLLSKTSQWLNCTSTSDKSQSIVISVSKFRVYTTNRKKRREKGVLAPNSADYGKQARSIVSAYLSHRLPSSFHLLVVV
jgi:hypothetical protein